MHVCKICVGHSDEKLLELAHCQSQTLDGCLSKYLYRLCFMYNYVRDTVYTGLDLSYIDELTFPGSLAVWHTGCQKLLPLDSPAVCSACTLLHGMHTAICYTPTVICCVLLLNIYLPVYFMSLHS